MRAISAERAITLTGRCARRPTVPASVWPPPAVRRGDPDPDANPARATTRRDGNSTANGSQIGQGGDALVDLERDERGQPEAQGPPPPRHPQSFAIAHDCGVTRVSDTRPRVVCDVVSTTLAVIRLDPGLPMPSRAHDGDAGRRPLQRAKRSSWRPGSARWCGRASRSPSRSEWSGWCTPLGIGCAGWAFDRQQPGHDRRRLSWRDQGRADQPRPGHADRGAPGRPDRPTAGAAGRTGRAGRGLVVRRGRAGRDDPWRRWPRFLRRTCEFVMRCRRCRGMEAR